MQLNPPSEFIDEHRRHGSNCMEQITFKGFILYVQDRDTDLVKFFMQEGCSEAYSQWLSFSVKDCWREVERYHPVYRSNTEILARATMALSLAGLFYLIGQLSWFIDPDTFAQILRVSFFVAAGVALYYFFKGLYQIGIRMWNRYSEA